MSRKPRILFITGTDTGVGKTVLTALLLVHFREAGYPAVALKPFCSGGRADAELLHSLQDAELTLDEINPFHYEEPLAPLVAARLHGRKVPMSIALSAIRHVLKKLRVQNSSAKIPILLIEGAGGLLSPLGESRHRIRSSKIKRQRSIYSALDLIKALDCEALLVAPNRLGTINQTRLAAHKLQEEHVSKLKIVLTNLAPARTSTIDVKYNGAVLCELLARAPVLTVPWLGKNCLEVPIIKKLVRKLRPVLSEIAR